MVLATAALVGAAASAAAAVTAGAAAVWHVMCVFVCVYSCEL